jgi:hypothetical protein
MNRHERRATEADARKQGKPLLPEGLAAQMFTLADDHKRPRAQVHVNKTTGQPGVWLYGPEEQPLAAVTATAEGVGYVALFGPNGSVGINAHGTIEVSGPDGIRKTYQLSDLFEKEQQ